MPITVLDIKAARSRHGRNVVTDVGTVVVPGPVIKELGIEPNSVFSSLDDLRAKVAEVSEAPARERLLRLLAYRERSIGEVRASLTQDGYPTDVLEALVSRFVELGLLDDSRFAYMLARTRRNSGKGRWRIERDLSAAGIDPDLIESVLDSECPADLEVQRAASVLGGRIPRDSRDRERLCAKLVRRGFSYETARSAVNAPGTDTDTSGNDMRSPQT